MFFLHLIILFIFEDNGKDFLFLFFCVHSFSHSCFLTAAPSRSFTPRLITKAAAVLCDLVIMLMSCNKDYLHLALTSNSCKQNRLFHRTPVVALERPVAVGPHIIHRLVLRNTEKESLSHFRFLQKRLPPKYLNKLWRVPVAEDLTYKR